MTSDDIIRMFEKANGWSVKGFENTIDDLKRFANLVAAAEREACAKVCEVGTGEPIQMKALEMLRQERERIAKAIRARGQE